jgi:hypothetical protein
MFIVKYHSQNIDFEVFYVRKTIIFFFFYSRLEMENRI